MRKALFVGQTDTHRILRLIALAPAGECVVTKIGLLVAVEIHVHRVERDECGQQRGVGLREVASGDQRTSGATGNRRAYFGELQVQLRIGDSGLGTANRRVALRAGSMARLEFLAGDDLRVDQGLRTGVLRLRQRGFAAGAFERSLSLRQLGHVATLIDDEQQVAFFHFLAFLKCNAIDIAGDAWTQVHRFHGTDTAGEVIPLAHVARDHLSDADFRCGWPGGGRCRTAAASRHSHGDQDARRQGEDRRCRAARERCIELHDVDAFLLFDESRGLSKAQVSSRLRSGDVSLGKLSL